jgi:hypothetical protein
MSTDHGVQLANLVPKLRSYLRMTMCVERVSSCQQAKHMKDVVKRIGILSTSSVSHLRSAQFSLPRDESIGEFHPPAAFDTCDIDALRGRLLPAA